ncbi:MAG: hypothetical protein CMD39_03605, partial [Gammaproteobacteria bacterium]|nr:hypothetical protein [Gammaproteobacteria bacterium]
IAGSSSRQPPSAVSLAEVSSHDAYGVRPEMFAPLLAVVRDAAREATGGYWNADTDAAWNARLQGICAAIDRVRAPV